MVSMLESPLRRFRKDAGLNQVVFARLAGVSQGYISQVDQGFKKPTGKVARLLEALGILEEQEEFVAQYFANVRRELEGDMKKAVCAKPHR